MPEHNSAFPELREIHLKNLNNHTALTPLRWSAAVLGMMLFGASASAALAQEAGLQPGESFVTRFSGLDPAGGPQANLDVNGTVGSIIDLRNPGSAARGEHWLNEPQRAPVTAGAIGQVFGIAFDNASPPNIYLTATSAFGLHRMADNSDWMPGMWGPSGGPGTIYRLSAANGYQPEVFADITLEGRPNSGAALGNIAFDAAHNQLLVSDMETGMIHRISAENGQELGRFDHGTEGRGAFVDAASGESRSLAPVAFDPASAPNIDNCGGEGFAKTPSCWNVADFRRRVWGLGVNTEADGSTRLYYAVWGSQAFGNPDWQNAGEDQSNSLWSVAIGPDGSFNRADIRRELIMPGFFTSLEDFKRAGGSHPVSDIAFSSGGVMLLAERGGLAAGAGAATPYESRVLRLEKSPEGVWTPTGRHDVGFYDRKDHGQPFLRANSGGGVDFGFGYSAAGQMDPSNRDGWVWMSGDGLCSPSGPCFNANSNVFDDTSRVDGLQGQPADAVAELSPTGAYNAYPASGPATAPVGPDRAFMIDLAINVTGGGTLDQGSLRTDDATASGDVEVYRPVAAEPVTMVPPPVTGFDLSIFKSGPARCSAGSLCTWQITVTNNGPAVYSGPINVSDILSPFGAAFTSASPPWACDDYGAGNGQWVQCYHPATVLSPGQSLQLTISFTLPAAYRDRFANNCAEILWPMRNAETISPNLIRDVQSLLGLLGYQAGPADGVMGNMLQNAIRVFQTDNGLAVTGVIDAALLAALYPQGASLTGDMNPANDRACASTTVDPGHLPPGSVHLPIGSFHRPPKSPHLPRGSFHRPPKSPHFPKGSFHRVGKSPHFPRGSFHRVGKSPHFPRGSFHRPPKSPHIPRGSKVHIPRGSKIHLPLGSNIHRPIGSKVHIPRGSKIHLPLGSNIHRPIGSKVHIPRGSRVHRPLGSRVHIPRGSKIHRPKGSRVHIPRGSRIHRPKGSRVHIPRGSRIHRPKGSRIIHKPRGSRVHLIRKSRLKTKVIKPHKPNRRVRVIKRNNNN